MTKKKANNHAGIDPYCSVGSAAKKLGCTTSRVRQLISTDIEGKPTTPGEGVLKGRKLDSSNLSPWLVLRESVDVYAKMQQTTGRPRIAGRVSSAEKKKKAAKKRSSKTRKRNRKMAAK